MEPARLKYRIVGGIVLVSLLAILVPVLNDMRQPLPKGPEAIDIPPEPADEVASSLPDDSPPLVGTLPEPQDIPPPVAPPPPTTEGPPPPESADTAKAVATPTPAPLAPAKPAAPAGVKPAPAGQAATSPPVAKAGPAATTQQAWVVQLGTFSSVKTAVDLRERLRKAGYSAFTEDVTTAQGKALRVRVGPEFNRATSLALRDRLAKETGQTAIVMPYP